MTDVEPQRPEAGKFSKNLSYQINPPTSLVHGGWHVKGRKKAPEPRNTRARTLYGKMVYFFQVIEGPKPLCERRGEKTPEIT